MSEIFRSRNKKLQHLGMHSQSVQKCECEHGVPSQASGSIFPLAQLPSPSIVAALAYASQYQIPTGRKGDAWSWHGSFTQVRDIPRRHSTVVPLAVGTTFSGDASSYRTAPSSKIVPHFRFTHEELQKSRTQLNTAGFKGASAISIFDAKFHSETSASSAPRHRVPFQYTHDRLQTRGHAYFGNIATADAFVNAVSLRRPSLVAAKEQDGHRSSDQVAIRARVLPKGVERKPFLIQRQFDIRELRDSLPVSRPNQDYAPSSTILRRSSKLRRLSLQQIPILKQVETIHPHVKPQTNKNQMKVPIHIEYALHYLLVLAALMLSGHIRKGDSIDLPLPSPKAWIDTIAYVYTGQGEVTSAMKKNIVFLAGWVESEG